MPDHLTLAEFRGRLASARKCWTTVRVTIVLVGSQREELLAEIDNALAKVARLEVALERVEALAKDLDRLLPVPTWGLPVVPPIWVDGHPIAVAIREATRGDSPAATEPERQG